MKKLGLFSLLILFLFSACREDINDMQVVDDIPDPTIIEGYEPALRMIDASLIGFVVDENNDPVTDATVILGDETVTTDNFGHFFFNNREMNQLGTLVKVEKAGYFQGSRRFFPNENAKNRVKIELLTQNFDQSFDAQTGGTINLPSGASVKFNANSIQTSDGTAYTGNVRVASKWMDPSALRTFDQMPGSLQGVGTNTNNEEVGLGTYGMIAVELEGDAGQALNIAEDATATLTMPIPSSLQTGAPAEIPLWSYNEEYGIWVEESSATLEDNVYVGEVSHFSFWNCDIPLDYIELSMTLQDDAGTPVSNLLVTITLTDVGCGSGYTDDNGSVNGFVPGNETLLMEVFDICGNALLSQEIGPFADATDLGVITVTGGNVNNTSVSGDLVCNGDPVMNSVIVATYDNQSVYHYIDGSSFDISFTTCATTTSVDIQGYDLNDLAQSDVVSVSPSTSTDIGTLNVCVEELSEYIELTVDGVTAVYVNPNIYVSPSSTYVEAIDSLGQSFFIGFGFGGSGVGDYSDGNFFEVMYDTNNEWELQGSGFDVFNVLEYGDQGEEISGEFEGTLTNSFGGTSVNVDVQGSFRVIH